MHSQMNQQKNCSPEYFRTVFSLMPSVFSRSFQFFFYEIQIRFHSTKKSWTETYIWIQYCTCVFPCLSLSTFFFSSFFTPSLITITKENVKMLHTNYLRLCLCARKASCNPDNPETSWIQKWYQKSYFCFIISKTILNLDSWILPRGSPCLNFKISNDRVKDLSICSEKFLVENCVS